VSRTGPKHPASEARRFPSECCDDEPTLETLRAISRTALQATGARVLYIGRNVLKRTVAAGALQITDWERPAWSIQQAVAELEVSYDASAVLDNAARYAAWCNIVHILLHACNVARQSGSTASSSASSARATKVWRVRVSTGVRASEPYACVSRQTEARIPRQGPPRAPPCCNVLLRAATRCNMRRHGRYGCYS
jgi:hypothetical protein